MLRIMASPTPKTPATCHPTLVWVGSLAALLAEVEEPHVPTPLPTLSGMSKLHFLLSFCKNLLQIVHVAAVSFELKLLDKTIGNVYT